MEFANIHKNNGYYEYKLKESLNLQKIIKILSNLPINFSSVEFIGFGDMYEEKNSGFYYNLDEFVDYINANNIYDIEHIKASGILDDIEVTITASVNSRYLKIVCIKREILDKLSQDVTSIR